jgi:hypothetical protein
MTTTIILNIQTVYDPILRQQIALISVLVIHHIKEWHNNMTEYKHSSQKIAFLLIKAFDPQPILKFNLFSFFTFETPISFSFLTRKLDSFAFPEILSIYFFKLFWFYETVLAETIASLLRTTTKKRCSSASTHKYSLAAFAALYT